MGTYNSFVIRVWTDDYGRVRGTIEHVRTGNRLVFESPEGLLPFVHSYLWGSNTGAQDELDAAFIARPRRAGARRIRRPAPSPGEEG